MNVLVGPGAHDSRLEAGGVFASNVSHVEF